MSVSTYKPVVVWRVEKEKSILKTETEDLKAQIDHLTKAKVCNNCRLGVGRIPVMRI